MNVDVYYFDMTIKSKLCLISLIVDVDSNIFVRKIISCLLVPIIASSASILCEIRDCLAMSSDCLVMSSDCLVGNFRASSDELPLSCSNINELSSNLY
jgi:hypothetical protein